MNFIRLMKTKFPGTMSEEKFLMKEGGGSMKVRLEVEGPPTCGKTTLVHTIGRVFNAKPVLLLVDMTPGEDPKEIWVMEIDKRYVKGTHRRIKGLRL